MIRFETLSATAFGGAVTLAEWWDNRRITEGIIAEKDVLKKASFYTYGVVGLVATLSSIFRWLGKWDHWIDPVATGFLYDIPRFSYNLWKDMGTSRKGTGSAAVREAQRVAHERQLQLEAASSRSRGTERSYQPEFNKTMAW